MVRGLACVMVVVFCAAAAPCLAQQQDAGVEAEIKQLLQQHEKAFREKDLEGVMELYAPGPDTVLLGTGPGERWMGKEEIAEAYAHFFEDFDRSAHTLTWWSVGSHGDVAWLTAMVRYTYYLKNFETEFGLNLSAVFKKIDGSWRFVAVHFSNLATE